MNQKYGEKALTENLQIFKTMLSMNTMNYSVKNPLSIRLSFGGNTKMWYYNL